MLDSPQKQMEEGGFLEGVWETVFDVGIMKACHVELNGLKANLIGKVSSEEAKQVFSGREAGPSMGVAKVGVPPMPAR